MESISLPSLARLKKPALGSSWHKTALFTCLAAGTFAGAALADIELRPSVVASHLGQPFIAEGDYNLKFREVRFNLSAGLGIEYNDNINLAEDEGEGDFAVRPSVGISAVWPVTRFNSLRLNANIGYTKYFDHPDFDSSVVDIAPDTELSFDIFVGNFVINLHDRPSIQTDPVGEPTVSNTTKYGNFLNTAGVTVFWAVNSKLSLTIGYDHTDSIATTSDFSFADYSEDQISGSTRTQVSDRIAVGLEGSAAYTRYRENQKNDAYPIHVGAYVEALLSPYTTLRVAGGYQSFDFNNDEEAERIEFLPDDPGRSSRNDRFGGGDHSSYYWNLLLTNRTTRHLSQTLVAGREAQLGVTAQRVNLLYARYSASWQINSRVTLAGDLFFEDGQEYGAFDPEEFQRYGAGISTSYRFSRKLTGSLGYQFVKKDSDLTLESYRQNRVFVQFAYDF